MVEMALVQVEGVSNSHGLRLRGWYHANEGFRDVSTDVFTQRVADKVADNCSCGDALLATVDNKRLGVAATEHALIVSQNVDGEEGITMMVLS